MTLVDNFLKELHPKCKVERFGGEGIGLKSKIEDVDWAIGSPVTQVRKNYTFVLLTVEIRLSSSN